MKTIPTLLAERLRIALDACGMNDAPALVHAASDKRFGDYQTNVAMTLAKSLKDNPREVAGKIIAQFDPAGLCETPAIAGAGFINFTLARDFLAARTAELAADPALGVPATVSPRKIIIDFSSPNVAKPMHVGHIRSTILGDTLTRVARFLGHEVITDNHLGDWGTQFGKVIYGWKNLLNEQALADSPIDELVRLYKETNALSESDPKVLETCRQELVKLQAGDAENHSIWQQCVNLSWKEFEKMYALLDITFDERLGESFYNDRLPSVCKRLESSGLATTSEGALCVFFHDIPALTEKPCLVRKSDGGFNYATTDIATIEYRIERWNADEAWYVVGAPQQLHLTQVFEVAQRMGHHVTLRHVPFGSILGEDRKIMKTRSGENVSLAGLLNEACDRALKLVAEKNPDMPEDEREATARAIGIGAVKYADLSQFRMTDYIFSWERMLSFQGNTAPYLQNACVRIRSIFRRAELDPSSATATPQLGSEAELVLAKKLQQFGETVPAVLDDFRPNLLANYLYELATAFHGFYEACPVLKSEGDTREERLALCSLTLRTLEQGLNLLGIQVPKKM